MAKKKERRPANSSTFEALGDRGADIFAAVGQREGELLHQSRARFLHVVAGNGDGVKTRHLPRRILDDVGDDPHRGLGRVDIGVADHELLEDVVLDRARQFGARATLFLAGDDEGGEDRDHRAVHRHRDGHLLQGNAVEQDLHVLDAVNCHARLADVALDARMIAVVAAVGGEIEGDGEALLAGREVAAVEGIGGFRRREAGILADRPGAPRIHGGARAAHEGRKSRQAVEVVDPFEILRRIERLDVDALDGVPEQAFGRRLQLLLGKLLPILQGLLGHRISLIHRCSRAEISAVA